MQTTQTPVSDQTNVSSANEGNNQDGDFNSNDETPPSNDGQSQAERKLLRDVMRYKTRARDLEGKVEQLENMIEELKDAKLKETKDYENLYKETKKRLEDTQAKSERFKQSFAYSEKHRAVYPALKKAGLIDEAEKLLTEDKLNDLELEVTSTGRFNVLGVDDFVERFKDEYPFAFRKHNTPQINSGSGNSLPSSTKITPQMVIEAEKDPKKYQAVLQQYLKQQRQ